MEHSKFSVPKVGSLGTLYGRRHLSVTTNSEGDLGSLSYHNMMGQGCSLNTGCKLVAYTDKYCKM